MEININNRLILIVGPSTTGKTTVAKKINSEAPVKSVIISHDEVLKKVNKNQSQAQIDLDFRLSFIDDVTNAINNSSNELVILDTVNFNAQALFAILCIIRKGINYTGGITLIKMNPPLQLHKKCIIERAKTNKLIDLDTILSQRKCYNSSRGSLFTSYNLLVNEEFIIQDIKNLTLNFSVKEISNNAKKVCK